MQHFPKPLKQFLRIKFNGLLIQKAKKIKYYIYYCPTLKLPQLQQILSFTQRVTKPLN